MSPELVQEKPYDHNSDLWSVSLELSLQFILILARLTAMGNSIDSEKNERVLRMKENMFYVM